MFYEKRYGGAITGFKVMSEDGSTLNSVNFDGNFVARYYDDCNLTIINGKYYLLFSGYILDETNSVRINVDNADEIKEAIVSLRTDENLLNKLHTGAVKTAEKLDIISRAENILKFMELSE